MGAKVIIYALHKNQIMERKYIRLERENRLTTIVLDRPEKRNALNSEFVEELKQAFEELKNDSETRVIRLKSSGSVFCAGADLAYLQKLQSNSFEENLEDSRGLKGLFELMYTHPKPIIAQVEGAAIAGGCGLASVCDLVFSVPEAKYGYTETKIGFVPAIVSVYLMRKIGESMARDILLTGRIFNANEAKAMGLIQYIYQVDEIDQAVKEFAEKWAKETSGDSIALTKKLIAEVQSKPIHEAFEYAAHMNAQARETPDCKAGIGAFLNKEKINW